MTDAQVQQVIDAILNATLLDNWHFYIISFFVSLLSISGIAFLKSYYNEKGKYSLIKTQLDLIEKKSKATENAKFTAIQNNLHIIEEQIKVSTETSEKIKTALNHDSWRQKELELNKRKKIEEYFSLILLMPDSLNNEMQSEFFDKDTNFTQDTFYNAGMIQALYLPEIINEHTSFFVEVNKFKEWIYIGLEMKNENYRNGGPNRPDESHLDQYQEISTAIHQPKQILLAKLKEISAEINT